MKLLTFILFIALSVSDTSELTAQNSDTLLWSPSYKLVWDDFKGQKPASNRFAAYTHTIISLDYSASISGQEVIPEFTISCGFNRVKSWVDREKPGAQSPAILAHEQLHFDIAELSTRKLRRALIGTRYSRSNYSREINSVYRRIVDEGEELQKRYDRETNHGLKSAEQKRWESSIRKQLEQLEKWASQP